jgi:hypothetical protein
MLVTAIAWLCSSKMSNAKHLLIKELLILISTGSTK